MLKAVHRVCPACESPTTGAEVDADRRVLLCDLCGAVTPFRLLPPAALPDRSQRSRQDHPLPSPRRARARGDPHRRGPSLERKPCPQRPHFWLPGLPCAHPPPGRALGGQRPTGAGRRDLHAGPVRDPRRAVVLLQDGLPGGGLRGRDSPTPAGGQARVAPRPPRPRPMVQLNQAFRHQSLDPAPSLLDTTARSVEECAAELHEWIRLQVADYARTDKPEEQAPPGARPHTPSTALIQPLSRWR